MRARERANRRESLGRNVPGGPGRAELLSRMALC